MSNHCLLCLSGELRANGANGGGNNGLNGSNMSKIQVEYNYTEGTNFVVDAISFCQKQCCSSQ